MRYLLDTNIVIYLLNGNAQLRKKILVAGESNIFLCPIVRGELLFGAYKSQRVLDNIKKIENFSNALDILPLTKKTEHFYGQIKFNLIKKGKKMDRDEDDNDLWIASVALAHNATLVSNDAGFHYIDGLKWENWFK